MGLLIDGAGVKAYRLSQDRGGRGKEERLSYRLVVEFLIHGRSIVELVRVTCMGCTRVPLTRRFIAIVVTFLVVTHQIDIVPIMIINIFTIKLG